MRRRASVVACSTAPSEFGGGDVAKVEYIVAIEAIPLRQARGFEGKLSMTYRKVQGGVVVLSDGLTLPEGTEVTIVPRSPGTKAERQEHAPSGLEKMIALAEWAESQPCDLPEDLARNHDHYLHGPYQRKVP